MPKQDTELRTKLKTDLERYKNYGTPFTEDMVEHVIKMFQPVIDKSVNEAKAEDTKRFNKLARIVQEYNIVHFVKIYKEAVKRDWQDVRVPIVKRHELTDYEPIAHLNKKGEE